MSRQRHFEWRYVPLVIWALFVAFPLYWVVITAFKDNASIYGGVRWLPWVDYQPNDSSWQEILGGSNSVLGPLWHSLVIGTVSTLLALILGCLAGYGLARFRLRAGPLKNDDIAFWIVSQRIMP